MVHLIRRSRPLLLIAAALLFTSSVGAEQPAPPTPEEARRIVQQVSDYLLMPVQRYREALARKQVAENLRRLNIPLYQCPSDPLPPGVWAQSILPYIEQQNLYQMPWALSPTAARLGALHDSLPEAFATHLGLPKDQGQILNDIEKGKAADKIGLRKHDILLKLDGKDVPRDMARFSTMLQAIKPDQPVDVLVLREGKRVEVKGLSMPKAPEGMNYALADGSVRWIVPPQTNWWQRINDGTSNTILLDGAWLGDDANSAVTTTTRDKDHFNARYRKGTLQVIVRGDFKDGKAKLSEISVWKDRDEKKYDALDKVPEAERDRVRRLLELAEKSPE